jgi:glutamate--cysteine ligase
MDELLAYFAAGEKDRTQFRVGTEHEKFGFLRESHDPLPYEGDAGIESILNAIAEGSHNRRANDSSQPWVAVAEGDHTVALTSAGASITLEPGGQLELSGAPVKTIHETCKEVGAHLDLLRQVCISRNVGFIGIGHHPTASRAEMAKVPKGRYGIMRRYMEKKGQRGLDMMTRTCTIQANFDYSDEADMVASFQTALAITPVVTALFANSPFVDGKVTGSVSERSLAWLDTDPDRTGFPDPVFRSDFGYAQWLEWVLDVPMYFIRRDGRYHDFAGASFRDFLANGLGGHTATLRDFEDHLTTAFPEVRLKQYLEVRGADGGPWSRICALPALWKGILYDPRARDAARALLDGATAAELRILQKDVAHRGFAATWRGTPVLGLAEELLDVSSAGLERQACLSHKGRDEQHYLDPLKRAVSSGKTFAEKLIDMRHREWGDDLDSLWEAIEFWPQDDSEKSPR